MRLRRETGDWTIKAKSTESSLSLITTQLPKGLSTEDFIGAILEYSAAAGVQFEVIDRAVNVTGMQYSTMFLCGGDTTAYYDRRSGHLSFDPEDFDPVEEEEDEGGEDVTGFVIKAITPPSGTPFYIVTPSTVTFTKADSENYTGPWQKFVGKTITDIDGETYTITEEMVGPHDAKGVPLYFVNPTDKSGTCLYLNSTAEQPIFPMTMSVSYEPNGRN